MMLARAGSQQEPSALVGSEVPLCPDGAQASGHMARPDQEMDAVLKAGLFAWNP
jgi:hypothetical protein